MNVWHVCVLACLAGTAMAVRANGGETPASKTAQDHNPQITCKKGYPVKVPSGVKGLPVDEALKMLKAAHIDVDLPRHESLPSGPLWVAMTNPYPGAEICSGTLVRLSLKGRQTASHIGSMEGMRLDAARAYLRKLGLSDARVQLIACGRPALARDPGCGTAFEVADQSPGPGTSLRSDTGVRLQLRRIDSPPADLGVDAPPTVCAHDGENRNVLAWRERRQPALALAAELRDGAVRVEKVLRRLDPPDQILCEVSVISIEQALPSDRASQDNPFPWVPALIAGAGAAPLTFRLWRRRRQQAERDVEPDTELPLPQPRVIVDIPRTASSV